MLWHRKMASTLKSKTMNRFRSLFFSGVVILVFSLFDTGCIEPLYLRSLPCDNTAQCGQGLTCFRKCTTCIGTCLSALDIASLQDASPTEPTDEIKVKAEPADAAEPAELTETSRETASEPLPELTPECITEICNQKDDDCDGKIDNGLKCGWVLQSQSRSKEGASIATDILRDQAGNLYITGHFEGPTTFGERIQKVPALIFGRAASSSAIGIQMKLRLVS